MSFATFEGNGFRHKAGRLGLASEEFPEREKGSKIRETSGFYEFCWGNLLLRAILRNFGGIFRVGLIQNPEVADHTRWRLGNCVFLARSRLALSNFQTKTKHRLSRRRAGRQKRTNVVPWQTEKTRSHFKLVLKYRFLGPWWTK